MAAENKMLSADDLERADEDLELGRYQLLNLRYSLRFQRIRFAILLTLFTIVAAAVVAANIGRFVPSLTLHESFSSELSSAFAILGLFLAFELASACSVVAGAYLRGRRLEQELAIALRDAEEALDSQGSWHVA